MGADEDIPRLHIELTCYFSSSKKNQLPCKQKTPRRETHVLFNMGLPPIVYKNMHSCVDCALFHIHDSSGRKM